MSTVKADGKLKCWPFPIGRATINPPPVPTEVERLRAEVESLRAHVKRLQDFSGEGSTLRSQAAAWPVVMRALNEAYGGAHWLHFNCMGMESAAIAIGRLARGDNTGRIPVADCDELAGFPTL